ncbi:MAG: TIGR00645 family protein [Caulobacter sp.]|nr:TIGR00645 family protein [Caulobacter sp.]
MAASKIPPVEPRGPVKTIGAFVEKWLEAALFGSRWLMAPFYIGLVGALIILMIVFFQEMLHELPLFLQGTAKPEDGILLALSLIDLSLAANLVLIVIFSGYENFVSKINTGNHEDRPAWMGSVDFSGLKMKLIGSIVAISAISLLRSFLTVAEHLGQDFNWQPIAWQVIIHLTFVFSGVMMAVSDWLQSRTVRHHAPEDAD